MQQRNERADGDDEQAKPDRRAPAMPSQRLLGVLPGFRIDTVRFVCHDVLRFKQADLPVAQRDGSVLAEARLITWMCVPEAGAPRLWFWVRGPGDVAASLGLLFFLFFQFAF
jgi:hypothetical protein